MDDEKNVAFFFSEGGGKIFQNYAETVEIFFKQYNLLDFFFYEKNTVFVLQR